MIWEDFEISNTDLKKINQSLEIIINGSIFEEDEFHSITGYMFSDLSVIFNGLNSVSFDDIKMINYSLCQLLFFPHGQSKKIENCIEEKLSFLENIVKKLDRLEEVKISYLKNALNVNSRVISAVDIGDIPKGTTGVILEINEGSDTVEVEFCNSKGEFLDCATVSYSQLVPPIINH